MATVSTSIDKIAEDGMTVAEKGAYLLIAFGGIAAGVGAAVTDIKTDFMMALLEVVGLKSEILARALSVILSLIILTLLIALMAAMKSPISTGILLFFILMMGTYLFVIGIRTLIQIATGKLKFK